MISPKSFFRVKFRNIPIIVVESRILKLHSVEDGNIDKIYSVSLVNKESKLEKIQTSTQTYRLE